MKKGFSLIELVIVIGLMSLLSLAISSIMLTTIMTSNKLKTATKIKQAGSYATVTIETLLRNAKAVTTCDSTTNTIKIVNPDGGQTTLFAQSDGVNTRIASNSGKYLTPEKTKVLSFNLTCEPEDNPTFIKLSFDLKNMETTTDTSPSLHFETNVTLRNE